MFKKSKLTDWIIAGAVVYVCHHTVETIRTVKDTIVEVSETITRPSKVIRDKFTPKKSTPEKPRTVADRMVSLANRFFNK